MSSAPPSPYRRPSNSTTPPPGSPHTRTNTQHFLSPATAPTSHVHHLPSPPNPASPFSPASPPRHRRSVTSPPLETSHLAYPSVAGRQVVPLAGGSAPRSPTAVRIEEGNPFDRNDAADEDYVDYGDAASTSSLTEVQELSLDRSVRSRNSHQLPYPATAPSPSSTPPSTATDLLMRPMTALQSVWRGMMLQSTPEESLEMSEARRRGSNTASDEKLSNGVKRNGSKNGFLAYDDPSDDPKSSHRDGTRTRSLSMAYLQDPSPLFPTDSSLSSADTAAHPPHLDLPDRPRSTATPSPLGYRSPSSPGMLVPTLDSHRIAALRLKHARFSRWTLRFDDEQVEKDYEMYFWGRSVTRWRTFVAVAGALAVGYQIASLLERSGGWGEAPRAATTVDWVVLALAAILPMVVIGLASYAVPGPRMAKWIHHLSFLFLILIGPVLTCIRYAHSPGSGGSGGAAVSPAVTAPLYIVCLVASVFFLRLRFVYTVLATLVVAPTWYAVFGVDLGAGSGVTTATGAVVSYVGPYVVASVALFLACIVTCSIAYDLERTLRTQYLSDSRFLSITRNLQSQLEGLEKSMLLAAGRQDLTPADLDSPLEKAMLAVRALLMDPTVRRQHKNVLDVVMACLSSPNLLTPDLDLQVRRGQVEMDQEVEKWLFNEVARRKGLGEEAEADGVGAMQLVNPENGRLDEEEEEEANEEAAAAEDDDVFSDGHAVVEVGEQGGKGGDKAVALQLIAVAAETACSQDLASLRQQVPLNGGGLMLSSAASSAVSSISPASVAANAAAAAAAAAAGSPGPLFRHRRRSSSAIPLIPTLTVVDHDDLSLQRLRTPRAVQLLSRVGEFNFPIFSFADAAAGHPLLVLAHHLCVVGAGPGGAAGSTSVSSVATSSVPGSTPLLAPAGTVGNGLNGVVMRLGLNVEKFLNAMATIEAGYHADLAFHNSLHAADVLHCIHYMMNLPTIRTIFTDLEILSILLAAIIHDFDHPGVNNHFLIASCDRRALLYNDKSVLENHHCAAAFEVLSRRECNFMSTLDRAEYRKVRENVVDMVLATDLAQHFSLLTMFKKKVLTGDTFDPLGTREDRTLLMQMLMKCSDVSNPTKAWPEYGEWIRRITEEWFAQGDREKALGLPISPFCNRDGTTATNPAPSQASFIDFIVSPLFDAFSAWTDLGEIKHGLDANRAKWAAVIAAEKAKEEREKAAAAAASAAASPATSVASTPATTPNSRTRRNKSFPHLPGLVTGSPATSTHSTPYPPSTPTRSKSQYHPNHHGPHTPTNANSSGSGATSRLVQLQQPLSATPSSAAAAAAGLPRRSASTSHKRRSSNPVESLSLSSFAFGEEGGAGPAGAAPKKSNFFTSAGNSPAPSPSRR
ncbi:cAMP-specific 3',5'-cyclic phosphodiesterase 4C [Phlyctochytrium bullatum]|nr:cAMP-specific 3',5'-cyclic phosphodiesterase 4C [Phlyctochytrium bullatum]